MYSRSTAGDTLHQAAVGRRLAAVARLVVGLAVLACLCVPAIAGMLITPSDAARHGLERAWFAQVPVDASRSRVTNWYLYYDRLYCVTDSGLVSALNAETGARLWTKQIGRQGFPAMGPGANSKYLGVISGSRLYMLDRATGRLEWSRQLGSAPSSGPALTENFAFIALVTGRIEGYNLTEPETRPWYYQSKGRTYLRPTTTGSVVSWPTSLGYLYVSRADDPGVLFRLETDEDIVTSPAEKAPYLYVASLDGYLYSLEENTGRGQWRYSTGYPIVSSPAVVGDRVYVASLEPTLHAIETTTGVGLWKAPGMSHFAARGKERVYASDRYGRLLALDAKTGQLLGQMKAGEGSYTLVNDQSDRIFVAHDNGLVQCLHEIGANEPTMYRQQTKEGVSVGSESDTATAPPTAASAESTPPDDAAADDAPPAAEEPADEEHDDMEMEQPDEAPEDDNPFADP
jgi:outer membrane protein assembly factor BamB